MFFHARKLMIFFTSVPLFNDFNTMPIKTQSLSFGFLVFGFCFFFRSCVHVIMFFFSTDAFACATWEE